MQYDIIKYTITRWEWHNGLEVFMRYKISELSKLLDVSTNTVRRYEGYGHISSERDETNQYRYYNKAALTRLMTVRALRKYGFAHTDIIKMKDYNIQELIHYYKMQEQEMDKKIAYLTELKQRLSDDLKLLEKTNGRYQNLYVRDCISYSYVLYQSGEELLMEENRIRKIHEYLYSPPKVQMIYIIRKEDIYREDIVIHMGWAVKVSDLEHFKLEENEYTERYDTRKTLMSLEKLPVNIDTIHKDDCTHIRNLFKEPIAYMRENNLRLDGDLLGIRIATIVEDDEELEYILFNIPIAKKDGENKL